MIFVSNGIFQKFGRYKAMACFTKITLRLKPLILAKGLSGIESFGKMVMYSLAKSNFSWIEINKFRKYSIGVF